MSLFRSEEHLARWLDGNGHERGAVLNATEIADLAQAWWHDRLAPDWRPHTRAQNAAILDGLGLSGGFWELP